MIQLDAERYGILFDVMYGLEPGLVATKDSAKAAVRTHVEGIAESLDLTVPELGYKAAVAWCNEQMLDASLRINSKGDLVLEMK